MDRLASTPKPIGSALAHESAALHVAGTADYIDDIPEIVGTLHIALGLSPLARGKVLGLDLERIRQRPGVDAILTAADIPGRNDCGPLVHDDPVLATEELRYLGQPVFAVVANTRDAARRAARLAGGVIQSESLPPRLSAREAHAAGEYVLPPMHLVRGEPRAAIEAAPHRLSGKLEIGGQEQFYLEGQISYAVPREGGSMLVYCSTQHPSEMQHAVAGVLGIPAHRVQVICRRMGGGFGGKESQSAQFACIAALAAAKLGRPAKLRLDRDDDFLITGRRHPFSYDWEVGFDAEGRILGYELTMISDAGHSADLSGPVMTRAICHVDNAYWLPNVAIHGYSAKTNTQSNTAFRGFGGPQGAIVTEFVLDSIARKLGRDPLVVRRANYYKKSAQNVTPYGQTVDDSVIEALTGRLAVSSDYASRRGAIASYNATSPVLKRGIALTPVKFGISFNLDYLNQAGALVHVYTDGSVLANHGGTEMGQGLHTKVAMVVAAELGLQAERVRVTATDTEKVANTSATAASTGSDLNGKAAQAAAGRIRERLAEFAARRWGGVADAVRFEEGEVIVEGHRIPFAEVVGEAYRARVQLWSDGYYATPGLSWNRETLTGKPFFYFAYGAAVSEVAIDTLTGEWRLLRADLLHDVGRSLNRAVDLGQVEGGFIQGMGWLTLEELARHPESGMLLTHSPSTYKIPTANDGPTDFRVELWEHPNTAEAIHRSKAVGEPPLLLAFSVLLAIRDAISSAGGHRVDPPLGAPATPEAILRALRAVKEGR